MAGKKLTIKPNRAKQRAQKEAEARRLYIEEGLSLRNAAKHADLPFSRCRELYRPDEEDWPRQREIHQLMVRRTGSLNAIAKALEKGEGEIEARGGYIRTAKKLRNRIEEELDYHEGRQMPPGLLRLLSMVLLRAQSVEFAAMGIARDALLVQHGTAKSFQELLAERANQRGLSEEAYPFRVTPDSAARLEAAELVEASLDLEGAAEEDE